tara:strand:- start:5273 stop:6475 length:1203 start_codon:yes stop_codon:yes gene_type:complete
MNNLKNKNILLCVTGSIAAYKACEVLRMLKKEESNVQVMMSQSAEKFIGKATFSALSNNKVLTDLFEEKATQNIKHVDLSFELDAIIVVPATANILCKAANGIADDIVSTTLSICDKPILFAPAMNFRMWENKATIDAIAKLKKNGCIIVEPEKGYLASLHKGKGRLAEPNYIFNQIKKIFNYELILENKKILITAGPTQENIDTVRFISNRSSGKMGYALAEAAKHFGGDVTLISGPVSIEKISNIKHIDIVSAQDMNNKMNELLSTNKYDIIFMAAAVADYSPKEISENKIKSKEKSLHLNLKKNIDILKNIKKYNTLKIGFALETENGMKNAKEKMESKGLDYIILNYANEDNAGFDSDTNHLYLLSKNGYKKEFELDTKHRLSQKLIKTIHNEEFK